MKDLFKILKMFYSPKGLCEAKPEWGPFGILSILLYLEKGVGTFKFPGGRDLFEILKMFYPMVAKPG